MKNNFEHQINKLIKRLIESNKAIGWKNNPDRLHNGKYIKGELFDYIIFSKQYKCCFDAKETIKLYWQAELKDIKQAKNLLLTKKHGMDSFFLVYFYSTKKYGKLDIVDFFNKKSKRFTCSDFDFDFKLEMRFLNE